MKYDLRDGREHKVRSSKDKILTSLLKCSFRKVPAKTVMILIKGWMILEKDYKGPKLKKIRN